jgi:hypothetical protein
MLFDLGNISAAEGPRHQAQPILFGRRPTAPESVAPHISPSWVGRGQGMEVAERPPRVALDTAIPLGYNRGR